MSDYDGVTFDFTVLKERLEPALTLLADVLLRPDFPGTEANKLNQYVLGAGYVDDCFVLAANYVTSYSYSAGSTPPVLSHAFMFQIGLRTLATTSTTSSSGSGLQ